MSNHIIGLESLNATASTLAKLNVGSANLDSMLGMQAFLSSFQGYTIPHSAAMDSITSSLKRFSAVLKASTGSSLKISNTFPTLNLSSETKNALADLASNLKEIYPSTDQQTSFENDFDNQTNTEVSDDFVTFDKSVAEQLNLPESIAISVGENSVRMSTGVFLSLLSLLITLVFGLYGVYSSVSESKVNAAILEQEEQQTQLLKEQNKELSQLLNSVDTSSSSESDTIESLKESLQSLDSTLLD